MWCFIKISNEMQKTYLLFSLSFFQRLRKIFIQHFTYDATSKTHEACWNSNAHRKIKFHTMCPWARALFSMASLFRCQNSSTCFALSAAIHPFCLSNFNTARWKSLKYDTLNTTTPTVLPAALILTRTHREKKELYMDKASSKNAFHQPKIQVTLPQNGGK